MNKQSKSDRSRGDLNRPNVYTASAITDWAGRIWCGAGGIKMNQKYMVEVMAQSCNPRGVCELPVRYLGDHIGVGLRQAQRIISQLEKLQLITCMDVAPQGRPNDIVRKFVLRLSVDPDTWRPGTGDSNGAGASDISKMPLMRRIPTKELFVALDQAVPQSDLHSLFNVHFIGVRSKQLDFVSPDADTTDVVYRYKTLFLKLASQLTGTEVLRLHLIPKHGYRR